MITNDCKVLTLDNPPLVSEWHQVLGYLKLLKSPPRKILCFGKPGMGKSSWAASLHPQAIRQELSEGQFPDVLKGKFLLVNGSTVFTDGCATSAARNAVPVIFEEFDKMDASLIAPLQQICDDEAICRWTLDNGETITPKAGFQIIATQNAHPSVLPEALLDRFDIVLRCDTPHPGILRRLSPDKAQNLMNRCKNEPQSEPYIPKQSPRAFLRWQKLENEGVPSDFAAELVFGEGQSEAVQNACIEALRTAQPMR